MKVEILKTSRYGNWPMTTSHRPGELSIECPDCMSKCIRFSSSWTGLGTGPLGRYRLGDQSRDYAECERCKRRAVRYDPEDSNTHEEYFRIVADELKKYLVKIEADSRPSTFELFEFISEFAEARSIDLDRFAFTIDKDKGTVSIARIKSW